MMTVAELEARNTVLERENRRLRDQLEALQATQLGETPLPLVLGLSAAEETVLRRLMNSRGKVVSKESLIDTLYGLRGNPPGTKIIDVFLCKIRAKLKPFDIAITTVWGRGYMLETAEAAKIEALT